MKLDLYLTLLTKIKLKWTNDLNIRPDTIKLLEENAEKKLIVLNLGNDFLHMTSKAQTTKARNQQIELR